MKDTDPFLFRIHLLFFSGPDYHVVTEIVAVSWNSEKVGFSFHGVSHESRIILQNLHQLVGCEVDLASKFEINRTIRRRVRIFNLIDEMVDF